MQTITVAIADPDRTELLACKRMLRHERDIMVVGQTATCKDVVATVLKLKPRILLFSLGLCGDTDSPLLQALQRECPATRVVLLTDDPVQEERLMHALSIGACGYLTRDAVQLSLVKAVHGVDQGEAWVPRKMLGRILDRVLL